MQAGESEKEATASKGGGTAVQDSEEKGEAILVEGDPIRVAIVGGSEAGKTLFFSAAREEFAKDLPITEQATLRPFTGYRRTVSPQFQYLSVGGLPEKALYLSVQLWDIPGDAALADVSLCLADVRAVDACILVLDLGRPRVQVEEDANRVLHNLCSHLGDNRGSLPSPESQRVPCVIVGVNHDGSGKIPFDIHEVLLDLRDSLGTSCEAVSSVDGVTKTYEYIVPFYLYDHNPSVLLEAGAGANEVMMVVGTRKSAENGKAAAAVAVSRGGASSSVEATAAGTPVATTETQMGTLAAAPTEGSEATVAKIARDSKEEGESYTAAVPVVRAAIRDAVYHAKRSRECFLPHLPPPRRGRLPSTLPKLPKKQEEQGWKSLLLACVGAGTK